MHLSVLAFIAAGRLSATDGIFSEYACAAGRHSEADMLFPQEGVSYIEGCEYI